MTGHNQPSGQQPGYTPEPDTAIYDEEIVVQTRWVAREHVRLATRAVIEDREISVDLRREQLDIETTPHTEDDHG